MIAAAKDRITGTPLEDIARRALRAVRPMPVTVDSARADLYDAQTVEVARRVLKAEGNAIDIGANRGELLKHFVAFAPRGEHVAVEPLPRHAKSLRRRFPSVTVHQVALSDKPGTATFRQVVDAPEHSSLNGIGHDATGKKVTLFEVELKTLDEVAPQNVSFIKLDAEFAEYQILQGASKTLAQKPYIAFELGSNFDEVWTLLTDAGLGLYRLNDWLSGRGPATSMEALRHEVPGEYFFLAAPPAA